jgi:hypothetical protein
MVSVACRYSGARSADRVVVLLVDQECLRGQGFVVAELVEGGTDGPLGDRIGTGVLGGLVEIVVGLGPALFVECEGAGAARGQGRIGADQQHVGRLGVQVAEREVQVGGHPHLRRRLLADHVEPTTHAAGRGTHEQAQTEGQQHDDRAERGQSAWRGPEPPDLVGHGR